MSNSPTTTKAKAKAKADASVKATADAIVASGLTAEAKVTDAIDGATTPAAAREAIGLAIGYVIDAEASAFDAIVFGRIAIGRGLYREYRLAMLAEDSNTEVKPADEVSMSTLGVKLFKLDRKGYEALAPAKRPIARSWAALAEDYALFVNAGDGRWRAAYEASCGDEPMTVRGYKVFALRANANAKAEADEKGTSQSRSAVTRAKALAEVKRQAEAAAKAKADAAKAKADAADEALRRATDHPAASVVAAFPALSGRDLTSCFDVDVLDSLIATVTAWRDHVKAMSADDLKAAKLAAGVVDEAKPDEVTEAAVADVAKADEAEVSADVMAAAAKMLTEMMAAKS